jgi:hypothetical protein
VITGLNQSIIENHFCCLKPKCIPVWAISVQKGTKFRRFKGLIKFINSHRNTPKVISQKSPVTVRALIKAGHCIVASRCYFTRLGGGNRAGFIRITKAFCNLMAAFNKS